MEADSGFCFHKHSAFFFFRSCSFSVFFFFNYWAGCGPLQSLFFRREQQKSPEKCHLQSFLEVFSKTQSITSKLRCPSLSIQKNVNQHLLCFSVFLFFFNQLFRHYCLQNLSKYLRLLFFRGAITTRKKKK